MNFLRQILFNYVRIQPKLVTENSWKFQHKNQPHVFFGELYCV